NCIPLGIPISAQMNRHLKANWQILFKPIASHKVNNEMNEQRERENFAQSMKIAIDFIGADREFFSGENSRVRLFAGRNLAISISHMAKPPRQREHITTKTAWT